MSFAYLADPARPAWAGLLPGKPEAYFLSKGDGEHAKLFTDTFSVLLSGDETGGQFGIFTATCPVGDIIPTHAHADTHETFFILDGKVRVFVQRCPMAKRCRGCSRRATSASFPQVCCTPTGSRRRRR
jgi:quercetin 2,3-dioxygenase